MTYKYLALQKTHGRDRKKGKRNKVVITYIFLVPRFQVLYDNQSLVDL